LVPGAGDRLGLADTFGHFHLSAISSDGCELVPAWSFELQYCEAGGSPLPVNRAVLCFEFLRGPWEVVFSQQLGERIMFCRLPMDEGQKTSQVFQFAFHSAPITCFRTNAARTTLVSASSDGTLKMTETSGGALLDHVRNAMTAVPTALAFLGPVMVACGSSDGVVSLWDVSANRLVPSQRLAVSPMAITSIAGFVPQELLSQWSPARASTDQLDVGLIGTPPQPPWMVTETSAGKAPVMLAAGTAHGVTHVWSPNPKDDFDWALKFSLCEGVVGPAVGLTFSPCGSFLASITGSSPLWVACAAACAKFHPAMLPTVMQHFACN
ncbi:unnamed protein product, partial [Ostreobium quekettii]